ncbi:hypothetical protein X945_5406 [Burkholderia pseudomallei ABCPW 107]|nr:hypothetical protein X945_5406 [Burkholderia pseudomallei ABCPW 107]KGX51889.1 hypothetical protein Y025_5037 [Burkholderia pseudomallei TSV32]
MDFRSVLNQIPLNGVRLLRSGLWADVINVGRHLTAGFVVHRFPAQRRGGKIGIDSGHHCERAHYYRKNFSRHDMDVSPSRRVFKVVRRNWSAGSPLPSARPNICRVSLSGC